MADSRQAGKEEGATDVQPLSARVDRVSMLALRSVETWFWQLFRQLIRIFIAASAFLYLVV
jgi:hypothetical protein